MERWRYDFLELWLVLKNWGCFEGPGAGLCGQEVRRLEFSGH